MDVKMLLFAFAALGLMPVSAFALSLDTATIVSGEANAEITSSCTKMFSPVICKDRKFWNSCIAKAAGFEAKDCSRPSSAATVRPTPCASSADCSRPRYCTLEYAPVVCEDGKTYSNLCHAKLAGQEECERIVTSAADVARPKAFANIAGVIRVDAATDSQIKQVWATKVSAVKALSADFKTKVEANIDSSVDADARSKCTPATSRGEFYKCLRTEIKPDSSAYWDVRFAALIESTAKLSAYGVPQAEIDAFTSFVKEQSLAFQSETTVEGKRKIINETMEAWKEFRKKAYFWMVQTRIDKVAKHVESVLPQLKEMQAKLKANGMETARLDWAIGELEANLKVMTSTDATVTIREKWVAAHDSVQILKHINRIVNAAVNRQPPVDVVIPPVAASAEVAAAAEVAGSIDVAAVQATDSATASAVTQTA